MLISVSKSLRLRPQMSCFAKKYSGLCHKGVKTPETSYILEAGIREFRFLIDCLNSWPLI